ncbi:MAG: dockerin type I repeat-containing protein, partial [Firmicutes bacterium]|nr:dockerin type I repeat-containing protein [Bacillota bacterium]
REYTSPWTTGEHLSKGYSVKSVTWMPAGDTFVGGQYYTALFTIQADPAYYINENTEFYLNDTKVEPISISAGGTPGNTATVSITFAQKGDVNADGSIDDTDAALVLKHLGGIELLTGENLKCADMNNDGEYDIRDAIEILKNK